MSSRSYYNYYKWCCVPMCTNTTKTTPEKKFISVPKKEKDRKKWMSLARRTGIGNTSTVYCCEDHFDLENDAENYMYIRLFKPHGRIILKPGVVPTKFDCQTFRLVTGKKTSRTSVVEKLERKRIIDELLKEAESEHNKNPNQSPQIFNDGLNTHVVVIEEPLYQNFEIGEEKPDIDFETEENPICDVLIKKEPTEESYYFSNNQTKESKHNQNESIENKSIFNYIGEKDCKIDTLLSYIDAQVRKNLQKLSPEKYPLLINSISDVINEFMKNP